jgi:hypothetical protein
MTGPSDPDARVSLRPREVYEVGAIVLAGMVLRVLLALLSRGTNDIISWEVFANQIAEHGLLWMYGNVPLWNHPPLMGYMAEGLRALAPALGWPFPPTFKLVPIAADGLSASLIFQVWLARTGNYRTARRALLWFTLSLNAILVSGYHGNTDPLVGALVLAAAVGVERGRPFTAGALLAAAVNVKLIPLILAPLLIARSTPREIARFASGLGLGVLPFLPVLWRAGDDFVSQAVAYRSNFDNWGIPLLIRVTGHLGAPSVVGPSSEAYVSLGPSLIIVGVLVVAGYARWVQRFSTYERAALGLAIFLILTPGFGVQYTAILGPVLLAVGQRWGAAWAVASGLFLLVVYASFSTGEFPLYSYFNSPFRPPAAVVGFAAWAVLAAFTWTTLRRSLRPAPPEPVVAARIRL